ncbi:DsbA family oxidoreductase [Falsibacillus albus]|uniref:DsbA family oxidoreductase n=1 Tax=Falsibacillus albus TaxID=2478915 RepID=A0A3L7JR02_9BACI|nr:DsbA family oxidoreductase [Falsibacillus albus]
MRVEIWSDIACPFCFIGKRRFEAALEKFTAKDQVDIIFRSFQLNSNAPLQTDKDIHTILAEKYGMTLEKAKMMNSQITQQAKDEGLDFHFDTLIPTNTFDAHRVLHFAATQGKMDQMKEALLKAYFTDSLNIGDHETLIKLAESIGIDGKAAEEVLQSEDFSSDVRTDQELASKIGVTGVPFFVFNQKYAVSGAQSREVFLEVLEKVKAEDIQEKPQLLNGQTTVPSNGCSDDGCEI